MARQSFSDAIKQEPERFLKYVDFSQVKDFGDFDNLFREAFDTQLGKNAKIDSENLIVLFESPECKSKMREQVSDKEYEQLYGDGVIVKREPVTKTRVVTIISKKVTVKSHRWRGREIKGATRTTPRKFSNAEIRFLKVRKQKKVSPTKIVKEYEQHFSKSPRTSSSLRSKMYRI